MTHVTSLLYGDYLWLPFVAHTPALPAIRLSYLLSLAFRHIVLHMWTQINYNNSKLLLYNYYYFNYSINEWCTVWAVYVDTVPCVCCSMELQQKNTIENYVDGELGLA